jgi:hypothetical protein
MSGTDVAALLDSLATASSSFNQAAWIATIPCQRAASDAYHLELSEIWLLLLQKCLHPMLEFWSRPQLFKDLPFEL